MGKSDIVREYTRGYDAWFMSVPKSERDTLCAFFWLEPIICFAENEL